MTAIFKCSVCDKPTDVADDDPKKTFCPEHCPDHEYFYDDLIEWPICKTCGVDAPADYYDESDNFDNV